MEKIFNFYSKKDWEVGQHVFWGFYVDEDGDGVGFPIHGHLEDKGPEFAHYRAKVVKTTDHGWAGPYIREAEVVEIVRPLPME